MKRKFKILGAFFLSLLLIMNTALTGINVFAADPDIADYIIEYYYDGELDGSKTEYASAEIGTTITNYIDKSLEGYKIEKTEGLPLQVSSDSTKNIAKVFYGADPNMWPLLGDALPTPADISGTFSCEVGETASILSTLDNVASEDQSILYLKVYSAAGVGISAAVNKNNNEYTYSLDGMKVVAKCQKGDDQKIFTAFECTPTQAGKQTCLIELVKDGETIASGTVTLNVPYRVHDDSFKVGLGQTVDVKANDYITPKAKIVLCDASGTPIAAQTASDGSTYYEPATGLKVTNDGSILTVLDDSQFGNYTFWYFAQEPGKNGAKYYTDDNQVPATVTLKVSAAGLYSLADDFMEMIVGQSSSVNLYDNDTLPEGDLRNLDVHFYHGSDFSWEVNRAQLSDGTIQLDYTTGFIFDPATGELKHGLMDYPTERNFGYRVYFDTDDYIEAHITIRNYGLGDVYVYEPIPFGIENQIELVSHSSILPDGPYTISLCDADGSDFTPPQGVAASINDSNQLLVTADEPGMDIELYVKLEYNGQYTVSKVTMRTDYKAMPDQAEAPLGQEVSISVLDNDILPELSEIPGAVSRTVIICTNSWQGSTPVLPDPDGYCYPDRETETDPETGEDVTEWSIRVKIDDDGNALATIYRQKKSDFSYAVQYLDEEGNVVASYTSECTIYPVLNYTHQFINVVPEFSPADIQGYDGNPDSPNKWQIVKGDYYGDDYSVSADDGVVIRKNVAATDTENLFDIILDIRTPVSWKEFLEVGTCRLQNGNSDNSSNRVLLYSSMEEAEKIKQLYADTGSPDKEIVTVQVVYYHDDWTVTDNHIHTATKYVVKPSGGNFYFYYQDPTPDRGLHSEAGQSRKIMNGNVYYVDVTALYEKYSFELNSIIPDTVTDPMGDKILFKDFVYNPSDSASYADGTLTWDVGSLYNGAFEDLIETTVDGNTTYMHQYNLVYRIELDTGAPGFVSMTPYDTNQTTTFVYDDEGNGKKLDFLIPQVQGRLNGNLNVSKTVSGNDADSNKAFDFSVTLGDTSVNGVYGNLSFTNGVANFSLKDGESKTAIGLPAGISYKVSEADYSADGYVTTKSGDSGLILEGETVTAEFTNTKNSVSPKTGDDSHFICWLGLFVISIAALTGVGIYSKKRKKVN